LGYGIISDSNDSVASGDTPEATEHTLQVTPPRLA
jgi:hypothetical protein